MIKLEYSVDFTSYGACKSVFSRHRIDSNFDFSPNTLFHFLRYSQQSLHHVYFFSVFFDLCSTSVLLHQPLKSSNRPGIDYLDIKYMSQRSFVFTKKLFRNRSQRTVRVWLNGNTMLYETFACSYVSEAKLLCFSLCSQTFNCVERC